MKKQTSKLTDLLVLLVFAAMALSLLLVLLYGAGIYQRLTEEGDARYSRQTATQYILTRVRQGDQIQLEDFEDCKSLAFREEIEGDQYITRVYCYDGWLRELFSEEDAPLSPEDGEKILPLDKLEMKLEEELLTVELDGRKIPIALRRGRQVAE